MSAHRGAYQNAPPGPYTVLQALPQDDYGRRSYRVSTQDGGQVRILSEWLLIAAEGGPENDAPEPLSVEDDLPSVMMKICRNL